VILQIGSFEASSCRANPESISRGRTLKSKGQVEREAFYASALQLEGKSAIELNINFQARSQGSSGWALRREELERSPERKPSGQWSHRVPICVYRESTLPEEEGQWELDVSSLKSSVSFVSLSTFNSSSSFTRTQCRAGIGNQLDHGDRNNCEFPPNSRICRVCTLFRARVRLVARPAPLAHRTREAAL
jgi:hypothetical protein